MKYLNPDQYPGFFVCGFSYICEAKPIYMKKTLLFALMASAFSFAQTPITGYYGYINDDFGTADGTGHRNYTRFSSDAPLDHSATGANQIWNFTQLTAVGTSNYHNVAPTGPQVAQFPGTTRVVDNTVTINEVVTVSKGYFSNTWGVTGVENADFTVIYTDSGVISTSAMMNYNDTHSESIAGNYFYDGYEGTFTGTITSTVDAYGTLTINNGTFGETTDPVTRLKIVQSLSLQYPGFGTVGTAVFTGYHYYREGDLYPYFTSSASDFNIPLLGIDEVQFMHEAAYVAMLGLPDLNDTAIAIAPNPANNVLNIRTANDVSLQMVTILDINGRTVLIRNPVNNTLDISTLDSGVYFARFDTNSGSLTKKIIKR